LVAEGYKVIDVRDERQYEKAHIKDSEHIPLFVENKDMDPGTLVLKLLHNNYVGLLYGNAFTKPNPEFDSRIQKYPKDQKLLLVCQEGLRSGKAADELEEKGWQEVAFIAKGLNELKPGAVEKVGPRELKDAGKGGISQYQQPVSIAVGSVLIVLIGILQFFPDQARPFVQSVFGLTPV
jgi:rhodanese-related sulfurtransferase